MTKGLPAFWNYWEFSVLVDAERAIDEKKQNITLPKKMPILGNGLMRPFGQQTKLPPSPTVRPRNK